MAQHLQLLIHGLRTTIEGDPAKINALPKSAPDFEQDLYIFAFFSVVLFTFNWGCRWFAVEPLIGITTKMKGKMKDKFAQCAMEVVFYGGSTIIGLYVVPQQEWIWPSVLWWKGFKEGGHIIMRSDLRCYYLLYGARYLQAMFSVCLEHKRKDFAEMIIHHVVSVALIYVSYVYGWNRIGCVIMLLLDPADVFLHVAKMLKYTSDSILKGKPRKAVWQLGADIVFALFAIVFFVTRLVMYPYVCWSASVETIQFFPKGLPEWVCLILLGTLLLLQIYWFYLLVSAIVRMIRSGGIEDVRSDSEDDTEDAPPAKKTE